MRKYKEIRQDLVEAIDGLMRQEAEDGSAAFRDRLRSIKERLESEHFHIVVMGQFKRGKTTFINSMLGAEVLPSSVVPLTSINTVLRFGNEVGAEVYYLDGSTNRIDIAELPRYVTESENPENKLGVSRVEVFFPSPFLKDGVCLVDTPGTGSTYLHNDETAYAYLAHADAVIFMISADPPISRSELEFLHRVRRDVRKVFFVQNKIDYLDQEEREESLSFNRQAICGALGLDDVRIHPLSAKTALKAALSGDAARMDRSGLPAFSSFLEDFLMKEKGRVLLESNIKNLKKALGDEGAAVELEIALLTRPLDELEEKIASFREQMSLVSREREEIRYLIEGDHKRLVQDTLDADVELLKRRETEPLLRRFESFFEEKAHLPGSDLANELGKFIQDEIREVFTAWRHEEEERLSREFALMAKRYMDKANFISNRILEIAGELFGISLPHLEAQLDLSEEGEFWFKMGEPPSDLEVIFGAIAKALPRKLSHRLLKKSKKEDLLMLFDRHCGRVRYDFYLRLQKSVGILSLSVDEVIVETLKAIESGIEKAVERLRGGKEDLDAVLAGLRERQSRLARADEELAGLMGEVMEGASAP